MKRPAADPRLTVLTSALLALAWIYASHQGAGQAVYAADIAPTSEAPNAGFIALGGIIALIGLNALFVAAESALEELKPMHVKRLREVSQVAADRAAAMLDGQTKFLAASTFGSQLCRIALFLVGLAPAAALAPLLARTHSGDPYPFAYFLGAAAIVSAPVFVLNLVFGELVPKSYAALHPQRVVVRLFRFTKFFSALFTTPASLVVATAGLLTARFGGKASLASPNQAEEEILQLVETAEETGEIENEERELLHSVFEFSDTVAREVMTPRVDMDAISVKAKPEELVSLIEKSGHSRIPIFEETDDQIIGIVHAKDLLMASVTGARLSSLRALMRPALFVPENKNLHELLSEMKSGKSQMAIVQDEFGGTAGIVTIEDIVEELVGDIQDEYDVEEPEIVETDGGLLVDGRTHVDDVGERIGIEFSGEEFDTIGGYVFGLFGRQPKVGEFVEYQGKRFTVAESDGRRIIRLRIEDEPTPEFEAAAEL